MSSGRGNWVLAALAVLLAAGVGLWLLMRPDPDTSRSRGRLDSGQLPTQADEPGRAAIAAREVTIDGDGVVAGEVVDEDDQPLSGGRLSLWCLRGDGSVARIRGGDLTIDRDGRFSGPACRGRVCPQLSHPSRIPSEPWELRPGTEHTLRTEALPRVQGVVEDPSGQPVADARVSFGHATDDDDPTVVLPVATRQTSTDVDGVFSAALIVRPPCDPCQRARGQCHDEAPLPVSEQLRVSARAAGWAPGSIEIDVADGPGEPLVLRLGQPTDVISGTLLDAAGQPLPRAVLLARSESDRRGQHRAELDDGEFVFDALGEGRFSVRAIQDGLELLRREGVAPGDELTLRLPAALRDVELRVVDEAGEDWAGVQVTGGPFVQTTRPDADGIVRAQRVAPGTYILRVRVPRRPSVARDLHVEPAPAEGDTPQVAEIAVVIPRTNP